MMIEYNYKSMENAMKNTKDKAYAIEKYSKLDLEIGQIDIENKKLELKIYDEDSESSNRIIRKATNAKVRYTTVTVNV